MYRVIAVTGPTSLTDTALIYHLLDERLDEEDGPAVLLTAGSKGVDKTVEQYAKDRGHKCIVFRPYFVVDGSATYSPRHYFMVNKQLVDQCEAAIVIVPKNDIDSKTKDMIARLDRSSKEHEVIYVED
jgi:hypothetical protein